MSPHRFTCLPIYSPGRTAASPERLRDLSREAAKPISSLIQASLSSGEEQMQKILASLADDLSDSGSAGDWLDLERVAAGLFYPPCSRAVF